MIKKSLNTQIYEGRAHYSLLILRVSFGAMMLTHGWPKFQKLLAGDFTFADPLGVGAATSLVLAVLAEFLSSIGLIVGLFTRINAFLLAFTMFVAGFIQHGDDPFSRKEKALLYMVAFIVMMVMGGGKYSIDERMN